MADLCFYYLFVIGLCFQKDIRSYDMQCITMRRMGNQQLSMEVIGLGEERLSLVLGDCIFASEHGGNTKHVHQVCSSSGYITHSHPMHILWININPLASNCCTESGQLD